MRRMATGAGLQGRFTNHSVRKTMITNLLHVDLDSNNICQLSGHKNVQAVNNYAVASKKQQKKCATSCREALEARAPLATLPPAVPRANIPFKDFNYLCHTSVEEWYQL